MQSPSISGSQSDKNTQLLRNLFKNYSKQRPGRLNLEELRQLMLKLEIKQKPKPYEVNELFSSNPSLNINGLDEDCFIIWFNAQTIGATGLATLFINLRQIGQKIQSAAPIQIQDKSTKHSFLNLSPDNETNLSNQINLDILLSSEKAKTKLQKYQKICKKSITSTSIIFDFKVEGNADLIKQKLQGTMSFVKQILQQFSEGAADNLIQFINITCSNTSNQVILVIQLNHFLFDIISNEFDSIISKVDSQMMAELSLRIKSNSLKDMLSNSHEGLSSLFCLDFKIDNFLLMHIKQTLLQALIKQVPFFGGLLFLLQEVQLQIKTNDIKKHVTETLGIPSIDLSNQVSSLKEKGQISQIIDNFLPPESQELVSIIKNAKSVDMNLNVFVGGLNFSLGLKLSQTNKVFEMIL